MNPFEGVNPLSALWSMVTAFPIRIVLVVLVVVVIAAAIWWVKR